MEGNRVLELKQLIRADPRHGQVAPLVSVDALLDAVDAIYEDCKTYAPAGTNVRFGDLMIDEVDANTVDKLRTLRLNRDDFTFITPLAKGQFGHVSLVRGKQDGKVYAMKTLRKSEMIKQIEIAFFMEERHILASATTSKWIVHLHAAFQDEANLYLVMDYVPGGDIASLLLKADDGEFEINEDVTRFYVAEIVLALEDLHRLNFVHRDLKPGNVLIDANGHIKLADFGSCIRLDENGKVTSTVAVGTPDYISPEVLQANEGRGTYGKECDYWSLGITMYELLVGDPPFYADSLAETYGQIMNHKESFTVPNDVTLSKEAIDLLKHLICDRGDRLNNIEDVKAHPFFKGIAWDTLHETTPPFRPTLNSDADTSNFAELDDEAEDSSMNRKAFGKERNFVGNNLAFIGYSFNKSIEYFDQNTASSSASNGNLEPLDSKLSKLETECDKLKSKLAQETKKYVALESTHQALEASVATIKSNLDNVTKELDEKETQLGQIEREKKRLKAEMDELDQKQRQFDAEKQELQESIADLRQKLEQEKSSSSANRDAQRNAQEAKAKLEIELESLNRKYREQADKITVLENSTAELNRTKAILELDIDNLKQSLEEERIAREVAEEQLAKVEDKIEKDASNRVFTEDALTQAEAMIEDLRKALESKDELIQKEAGEKAELKVKLSAIENAKLKLEQDLINFQDRCKDLSQKLESTNVTKNRDQDFEDLERRLNTETDLRKRIADDLSAASREKTSVAQQLEEARLKLSSNEQELFNLKKTIRSLEDKMLRERRAYMMNRNSQKSFSTEVDTESMKRSSEDLDFKAKLEKKIADLQKLNALALVEIAELKKKNSEFNSSKATLEAELESANSKLHDESKFRQQTESKLVEVTALFDTSAKEIQAMKLELKKVLAHLHEKDAELSGKAKAISELEEQKSELTNKMSQIHRIRADLEGQVSSLKSRIDSILSNQIDPTEFSALAEECNEYHEHLKEAQSQCDNLENECQRLKSENEKLRQSNDSNARMVNDLTRQLRSLTTDLEEDEKTKRGRTAISKVKLIEQKLSHETTKRAALEAELAAVKHTKTILEQEVEDLRRTLQQLAQVETPRPGSVASSFNLVGRRGSQEIVSKTRRLRPILFPDNGDPVMQGWLKFRISKDKKGKYDWVKKYAVLRHSKLYIYDKEKDKDSMVGTPLVDLRTEAFIVRAVKPMELIHSSKKEIACIFTIQALASPFNSANSLDNTGNDFTDPVQVRKKLEALTHAIDKEEKFKAASEKMVVASSGDAKKKILNELDDCARRLKILRIEKAEYEKAAISLPDPEDSQTSPKDEDTHNDMSGEIMSEIEKKESIKSGVEKMLNVVQDNNTREKLGSQLNLLNRDLRTLKISVGNLNAAPTALSPRKIQARYQTIEHNGHHLKAKENPPSTTCYHCHDSFFGQYQSLECTDCHMVCHKFCYTLISETCQEHIMLKEAMKYYFMANDEADKMRWVTGIDCVRTNVREKKNPVGEIDIDSVLALND